MLASVLDPRTARLLTQLKQTSLALFGANLVGVYLHGSLVLGSYRPAVSDLDYLIVVRRPLTLVEKQDLMTVTLQQLWPLAPAKGLEFHVLVAGAVRHFQDPCPFDFHFSPAHWQAYHQDPQRYLTTMQGTDPDLAAHLTILQTYGQVLVGAPIATVFGRVPIAAYWASITADVAAAPTEIQQAPLYLTLNLCRVLAYQQQRLILSKAGGGRWGLQHCAPEFRPLIAAALQAYQTQGQLLWTATVTPNLAQRFATRCLQQLAGGLPVQRGTVD